MYKVISDNYWLNCN